MEFKLTESKKRDSLQDEEILLKTSSKYPFSDSLSHHRRVDRDVVGELKTSSKLINERAIDCGDRKSPFPIFENSTRST